MDMLRILGVHSLPRSLRLLLVGMVVGVLMHLGMSSLLMTMLLLVVDMLDILGGHSLLLFLRLLVVDVLKFLEVPFLLAALLISLLVDMLKFLEVSSLLMTLLLLLLLVELLKFLEVDDMRPLVLEWLLSSAQGWLHALPLAVSRLHLSARRHLAQDLLCLSTWPSLAGQLPI
jgi:hypothetical protein